jgi:exonuclease VII large subunit
MTTQLIPIILSQSKEIQELYGLLDNILLTIEYTNDKTKDSLTGMIDVNNDNIKSINTRLDTQDIDIKINNDREQTKMDKMKKNIEKSVSDETKRNKAMKKDLLDRLQKIKDDHLENSKGIKMVRVKCERDNMNRELLDKMNVITNKIKNYENKCKTYELEVTTLRNELRIYRKEKVKKSQTISGIKVI